MLNLQIFSIFFLISFGYILSFNIFSQKLKSSKLFDSNVTPSSIITHYEEVIVPTTRGVSMIDVTGSIRDIVNKSGCREGVVTVLSKHSTVSITINEFEPRLVDDTRQFLLKLAPPSYPYLHNDLDFRNAPDDWPGGSEAWRNFRSKEPVNAHSHLIAMLLGTSETIPINKGLMCIGKYQNIILVDADGPKNRSIAVQITGSK